MVASFSWTNIVPGATRYRRPGLDAATCVIRGCVLEILYAGEPTAYTRRTETEAAVAFPAHVPGKQSCCGENSVYSTMLLAHHVSH